MIKFSLKIIRFIIFRTIIVQNPFDNPSNPLEYHHDPSFHQTSNNISIPTNPMRFNQEMSNSTSLIPLPSPLPTNLGINHHLNQPSITPTMIGAYPPTGMYLNNPHITKIRPANNTPSMMLHYPAQSQVIMPQQSPIMYDPNILYRPNGHYIPDNNILKSLLQINPQVHNTISTIPKPRKKRKANDAEDDLPTKSRKRKSMFIDSFLNKSKILINLFRKRCRRHRKICGIFITTIT
jgi:hypothetical protein